MGGGPDGKQPGRPMTVPPDAGTCAHERSEASSPRRRSLRELPLLVVIAVLLTLSIKAFLVQAFFIPSGSMERTLHGCEGCTGDRVLVDKLLYDVRDMRRGEIVVFDGEGSFDAEGEPVDQPANQVQRALLAAARAVGAAPTGHKDYVKRVIGIPGDRVACCTTDGKVTVQPTGADGAVALDEPYVFEDDHQPFCEAGLGAAACPAGSPGVLVPEGRLWVMGDHRSGSADSRAHMDNGHHGTVAQDRVIGRAFVIVWPPSRSGVLDVPGTFSTG